MAVIGLIARKTATRDGVECRSAKLHRPKPTAPPNVARKSTAIHPEAVMDAV